MSRTGSYKDLAEGPRCRIWNVSSGSSHLGDLFGFNRKIEIFQDNVRQRAVNTGD